MKNLKLIGIVILFASCIVSCNDDNSETPGLQAIGDVFVRCKKINNDTVYAPVFYTSSNFAMKSVNVEGPADSNIDKNLSKFENTRTFRYVPSEEEFSTNNPVNGIYEFEITDENLITYTISDKLYENRIDPVKITDFDYNKTLHLIDIDWDEVENADTYVVKIHNQMDDKLIYISGRIQSSNYKITTQSDNWSNFNTVKGEKYIVGVYAYKFESTSAASGYDINCESVEYREIEW